MVFLLLLEGSMWILPPLLFILDIKPSFCAGGLPPQPSVVSSSVPLVHQSGWLISCPFLSSGAAFVNKCRLSSVPAQAHTRTHMHTYTAEWAVEFSLSFSHFMRSPHGFLLVLLFLYSFMLIFCVSGFMSSLRYITDVVAVVVTCQQTAPTHQSKWLCP